MVFKSRLAATLLLFVMLYACATQTSFAVAIDDGSIVELKTYSFPSYEQAVKDTAVEDYASKEHYQRAVNDPKFEFQKLKYMSDGLKVIAYLYKPVRLERRTLPAILFNRGSTVRGDIAPELIVFFHRLASEGFVVVAPMYRGSDGGEGHDEVGGADVNDLMNITRVARSLGFIDMNNLFMYGESRGGMMTYQAIKKDFPINAAAVFGAFTNMEALIKFRPEVYKPATLKQLWPDYETRKDEIVKSRSAMFWAEQLDVPLLIMHGGADWSVNPSQSLALAQTLQDLGRTYELIVYAEDGHILSRNQEDRDRRAIAWFKRHMKNKP